MAGIGVLTMPFRCRLRLPPRMYRRLFGAQAGTPASPRSVLVVREDDMSDLAIVLDQLAALRAAWPFARVTLLAPAVPGRLLWGGPFVDGVLTWDPGGHTGGGRWWVWRTARLLTCGRGRFDVVVLPDGPVVNRALRQVAVAAANLFVEAQALAAWAPQPPPVRGEPVAAEKPVTAVPGEIGCVPT